MVSESPKKPDWDQRLAEHLARASWEAANDPARRGRNPPFREQITSPYYWVSVLASLAMFAIWLATKNGWPHALALVLYLVALCTGGLARRDARIAGSRRTATTDETDRGGR